MIRVRESIAYCGLYCEECPLFTKEIANLAKKLKGKLDNYEFDRVAHGLSILVEEFNDFKNYEDFYKVLQKLNILRCYLICRDGGGSPDCKIRVCCQSRNLVGCWECNEFETCKKLEYLKPVNADNLLKNLRKLRDRGIDSYLKGKKFW